VNERCGCVGDFTDIEVDESTDQLNTFTFYREANISVEEIDKARPLPTPQGDTRPCAAEFPLRRVQLVRRDGRDMSTLYGRGGGGLREA